MTAKNVRDFNQRRIDQLKRALGKLETSTSAVSHWKRHARTPHEEIGLEVIEADMRKASGSLRSFIDVLVSQHCKTEVA